MKINRASLFSSLSEEDKERLEQYIDLIKVGKGKVLFYAGDKADFVYYILSGAVSVSDRFYDAFSGECIGVEGVMSSDGLYPVDARVDEKVELVRIPGRIFLSLFQDTHSTSVLNGRNAHLLRKILDQAHHRLLFSVSKFQAKKGGSAGSIANFLLYYIDTGQVTPTTSGLKINKKFTESEIAECCHCDRSTVARTLALFIELGIIIKPKREKFITVVSREQLNDFCVGKFRRN